MCSALLVSSLVTTLTFAANSVPETAPTPVAPTAPAESSPWKELEPGLELGTFMGPPSILGDRTIRVLRADPKRFELKLLNASRPGFAQAQRQPSDAQGHTAHQWSDMVGAVAAINASMFESDALTSVGYMKTVGHTNNEHIRPKYKAMLVFDPVRASDPLVQVLDTDAADFAHKRAGYNTQLQCLRMVNGEGKNAWRVDKKHQWSAAAISTDTEGRVLFIHVRSPYTMHELIDALLALPLHLRTTMYAEGGPEAQLYIHAGDQEFEWVGSYETGFNENDNNHDAWPIPNVVALVRKNP
jgi:hypothetical protein